ncbi:MAG: hypothetical protein KGK16_11505 [Bradyrhizobium sp.]|nr:hypothetical protein [Bradyrhizobium sp.]
MNWELAEYWIARSSRATTSSGWQVPPKSKGGPKARHFDPPKLEARAERGLYPGMKLLLFGLLRLLGLFRLLRLLSHNILIQV